MTDETHPNDAQTRVTVAQAAELLGLSAEAVRSRVQRGTLASTKEYGTVYVLLDPDQARPNTDEPHTQTGAQTHLSGDQTAFIASLTEQIDWLRREVERKDTIIMSMTQRIPELEPAPEPRESPVSASEEEGKGAGHPEEAQRPWWQRIFGAG